MLADLPSALNVQPRATNTNGCPLCALCVCPAGTVQSIFLKENQKGDCWVQSIYKPAVFFKENQKGDAYSVYPGVFTRWILGLWFSLKVHGLQIGAPPFLGFSYPNLLLVFLNLLFLGTCIICFSQVLDFLPTFSGSFLFYFILFFCTLFWVACDHGNSFLCLAE